MDSRMREMTQLLEKYTYSEIFHLFKSYTRKKLIHKLGNFGLYQTDWYIDILVWFNSGRGTFQVVADPYKIIEINTSNLNIITGRTPYPGHFELADVGLIKGGEWDQNNELVSDLPIIEAITKWYEQGRDWDGVHVGDTLAIERKNWCSHVEKLFHSISVNGYQRQKSLRNGDPTEFFGRDRYLFFKEIAVDIGRDGTFLFVDGRHRLAIARILGVEKIPVRISARHLHWQNSREAFFQEQINGELSQQAMELCHHPDFQDIIDQY